MAKSRCYRLPYDSWPAEDRRRWEALSKQEFDLFAPKNPLAKFTEQKRKVLRSTYGAFLGFVAKQHPERLDLAPGARLDAALAKAWLDFLLAIYRGPTIGDMIDGLRIVLSAMASRCDWSWLYPAAQAARSDPLLKPKQYRRVTSDSLLALGFQLMDSVEEEVRSIGAIHLRLAKRYRDGFIIALLACIPLRRRTLANLRIGEHLMKIGRKWSLDIPAEDTKSHVPLEYEVPHLLWDRLEIFLSKYRPRFKGAATHDHLWPCQQGGPLKGGEIYEAVAWRTFKAFGFSVSPHRFRHAAATFWSERDPANVLVAKDLLGHASLKTTEKHYIMSQSRIAGRELAGILADFKESARAPRVRRRKQRRRIRVSADGANPGGRRATTVPEQVAQATVGAAA